MALIHAAVAAALFTGLLSSGCRSARESAPDAAEEGAAAEMDVGARLKPGLTVTLEVRVLGKKELEVKAKRVSGNGTLVLPLVGVVDVTGMTLSRLSAELTKRYSEFLVDPLVILDFVTDRESDAASPWGYVTVLGKVKRPGRVNIPATQDLTVSDAIQRAGGLDSSAKDSAIRVSREKPDGTAESLDVNLRAVGSRGESRNDLTLEPGDVVFVPQMIF